MTALEIIALLAIIIGLLEFLAWLIKPQLMLSLVRPLYNRKKLLQLVCLIGAAVVFYFLSLEISIVKIVVAFIFVGFLLGVGISPLGPRVIEIIESQVEKKRFWKDYAIIWIIWFVLSAWALHEIFW